MRSAPRSLVVSCLLSVVVLVGCGGDDDGAGDEGAAADRSTSTTAATPADADADADEDEAGAGTSEPTIDGASVHEHPDGTFAMDVSPDWMGATDEMVEAGAAAVEEYGVDIDDIAMWVVEPPTEDFASNVNVTGNQNLGYTLEQILDATSEQGSQVIAEFEYLGHEIVEGPTGQELGIAHYLGSQEGRPLEFLAVLAVDREVSATATLTVPRGELERVRSEVEPYLRTLRLR